MREKRPRSSKPQTSPKLMSKLPYLNLDEAICGPAMERGDRAA